MAAIFFGVNESSTARSCEPGTVMDKSRIRQRLAETDAQIAAAKSRVATQQELVAQCFAGGYSTQDAVKLLGTLSEALNALKQRQELIRSELGDEQA